jgi:hypothetical protein
VASPVVLALGGCAQVLGIESGTVSPWFCNANVAPPSGMTTYDFHFIYTNMQPIPSENVTYCPNSGPPCTAPMSYKVMNGTLDFTVPASDDGYLALPAPGPLDPATLVELGPPGNVVPTERTFPVLTANDIIVLTSSLGIVPDSATGGLLVAAYDCNKTPADGVSLAVTIEGRPLPVKSGPYYASSDFKVIPSATATLSSGIGGFNNVMPADSATLTLTRASDQVVVATAPVHIFKATLTLIYLGPTKTQ